MIMLDRFSRRVLKKASLRFLTANARELNRFQFG